MHKIFSNLRGFLNFYFKGYCDFFMYYWGNGYGYGCGDGRGDGDGHGHNEGFGSGGEEYNKVNGKDILIEEANA